MKYFLILFFTITFTAITWAQFNLPVSTKQRSKQITQYEKYFSQQKSTDLFYKSNDKKPYYITDLITTKVDSAISTTYSDTSVYRFTYNGSGKLTCFTTCDRDKGEWKNYDRYWYEYNTDGRLSVRTYERWKKEKWNNDERNTLTYNSEGKILSELVETGDSIGWVNSTLAFTEYNSLGLVTMVIGQRWSGSAWDNVSRIRYEFNNNGNMTHYYFDNWSEGAWKCNSQSDYTYTAWGKESEVITTDYSNSGIKYRLAFEYNADRLVSAATNYVLEGGWQIQSRQSFSYSNNNTVIQELMEVKRNDTLSPFKLQIDTTDTKGYVLSSQISMWTNGTWIISEATSFTYNSKGKVLLELKDLYYGIDTKYSIKRESKYDVSGEYLENYKYTEWLNGVLSNGIDFISFDIDPEIRCTILNACNEITFWYKKIIIPVELSSFNASVKEGKVLLKWQTATETNNKGFEIERKTGNNNWVKIGYVQGKGTTATKNDYSYTDNPATTEKCFYRLKQIDFDGTVNYSKEVEASSNIINSYSLSQNYPNPFNPATVINYSVPTVSKVRVCVYDVMGRVVNELVNEVKEAGIYNLKYDASALSSGTYFYSIEASGMDGKDSFRQTKKMILVK